MPMFSSEMLAQMIRFYGSAQQTIMGQYMEQNVKAFLAIQKKLQDQAKQVYGDKMMLTPDLWKQFMQMQAPAMQGMLGNYLEQSAKLFMDMQQRMQDQTRGMFTAFPFPNFGAPPQTGAERRQEALISALAQHRALCGAIAARIASTVHAIDGHAAMTAARPPRVGFVSLGCPKALVDSEQILTQLRAEGYAIAPDVRRRRSRRRQHVRLHRRRRRRIARRDRRGARGERQGHRHRLPRREGRRRIRCATRIPRCSPSPARTRRRR